jgi:CheY-like chemotaxis protein
MAKTIEVRQNLAAKQLVYADRIRFKQILYNLLSNAIKFTPNNGRVTVECIDLDGSVRISVIDTGIGIRPEDQQLIFEEFRQIEGEGAQAGTGLGLAITKRLIEQHRGRIWLESKLEEGSQFSFVLPAGSAVGSSSRTEPSATAICGADGLEEKPLVLIVDDEGPARELLINYFEPEGYRVAAASSFNETLEKAKRLRPTAITLDISMAGQDGFQILLELKCTPETAHIPIVVVSIVDNKKMGFALGAADYLVKPVDKAVLLETIRKHAQRGGYAENVILLVDDDPGALEMLEVMLRSSGYRTLTAANGKGALAMLSAVPVNAILVDLLMPEMNGFELIGQIKQDPNLQDIPIVVLSAKRLSEEEKSLLRRDTEAFFEKDGSWREQLIAEVRRSTKSKPVSLAERGA